MITYKFKVKSLLYFNFNWICFVFVCFSVGFIGSFQAPPFIFAEFLVVIGCFISLIFPAEGSKAVFCKNVYSESILTLLIRTYEKNRNDERKET
ncbi:hypothetical protein DBR11_20475 [Pedobacter sp. HMWF019]|nr:hypothetical protein DBR11_20475 [Pedobacter sp. HMWF019]